METTKYECENLEDYGNKEAVLTPEEQKQVYVAADPSVIEVLPTGEIYVTQLEYRKKLTEIFGVGGWRLVPCSPWFEDANCRRQMWALEVRGNPVAYAWGEDETYKLREGDVTKNSPSFTAPEIAKSNALMRLSKDLLLFYNLWDKNFIKDFLNRYCERVPVKNYKTGRIEDQWRKRGEDNISSPPSPSSSLPSSFSLAPSLFVPHQLLTGTLISFGAPGTNGKKSGRALFAIGEEQLETTFFNVPTGASSFEELKNYEGKSIGFTYKQNGRWANLSSVQLTKNSSEIATLRGEIQKLITAKAQKENIDEVAILQRWGKTKVEDIATIDEATHICYELEQQ